MPLVLLASLSLAACGDDDSSDAASESDGASTGDTSGETSATAEASGEPIKLGILSIESGPLAGPGRVESIEMAVEEINADGGVDGRPIETSVYDAGMTPDTAINAVNQMLGDEPDIAIGLFITAQVQATAPAFEAAGVPLIHGSVSASLDASEIGTDRLFRINPRADLLGRIGGQYLVEELGAERVGLANTSDEAPHTGIGYVADAVEAAGGEVVVEREYAPTATDLTEVVLAMSDVDAMFSWGYPQLNALTLRQRQQNALTAPIVLDYGGATVVDQGLATPDQLDDVFYTATCPIEAEGVDRPQAAEFVEKFRAEHGDASIAPELYDAVYVFAAAIEEAGSVEGDDIVAALTGAEHEGVCGGYAGDDEHNLAHFGAIVSLDGGQKALVQAYESIEGTIGR